MIPNSSLLIRRDLKKNERKRAAALVIKEKRIFIPTMMPSSRQTIAVVFVLFTVITCFRTVITRAIYDTSPAPSFVCGPGKRFKPGDATHNDRCLLCPKGNYQDQKHHRLQNCKNCSIFNDWNNLKIKLDDCTRFHDIVVKCKPLFYLDRLNDCVQCNNCTRWGKFVGQACGNTSDAICCDTKDEMVKDGKCVDPKDFCPPGEFLVGNQTCLSCEDCKPCINQTTDLKRHNHTCNCTQSPNSKTTGSLSTGGVVGLVVGFICNSIFFFFFGIVAYKYRDNISDFLRTTLPWAGNQGRDQQQHEEPQNDANPEMSQMLNTVTCD